MAVQFSTASNRPSTLQNIYTQLHTNLIAAGWELVYADADAIGTGTASTPAWSKAPASGDAGRVIYRMPAVAGYATRWCLELTPGWSGASTQRLKVRTGTGVTGSALDGAGGTAQASGGASATSNVASTEWYVSVYEHGLLVALHTNSTGWMLAVERRRRLDGSIMDDISTYMTSCASDGTSWAGNTSGWHTGSALARVAGSGEISPQKWVVFSASDGAAPNTLNRMDGTTGVPQGPYSVSGGTNGSPRLFMYLPPNDAPLGVDATYTIDGELRGYLPANCTGLTGPSAAGAQQRVAYART